MKLENLVSIFCRYLLSRRTVIFLETSEKQRFKVSFASSILSVYHESLLGAQTRL